jgi:hypothetical protein
MTLGRYRCLKIKLVFRLINFIEIGILKWTLQQSAHKP